MHKVFSWFVQGSSRWKKLHTLIAAHDCASFSVRLLIALNTLSWMYPVVDVMVDEQSLYFK